jgi:hypothetical protein
VARRIGHWRHGHELPPNSINYIAHLFTSDGMLTVANGGQVEYLMAAGGGAGGNAVSTWSGGGGWYYGSGGTVTHGGGRGGAFRTDTRRVSNGGHVKPVNMTNRHFAFC